MADAKKEHASAREWLSKFLLPSADTLELAAGAADEPAARVVLPWNGHIDPELMSSVLVRET